MEKTELPSEQRLLDLRREGQIAYSQVATLCFVTIVTLLAIKAISSTFSEFIDSYRSFSVRNAHGDSGMGGVVAPLRAAAVILVVLPCMAAFGALGAGLGQTKMMITGHYVSFNLARLSPAGRFRLLSLPLKMLAYLVLLVICAVLSAACGYLLLSSALTLLNYDVTYASEWLGKLYTQVLPVVVLLVGAVMSAAYLMARQYFKLSHRMSRQEIEQEGG